MCQSGRGAHPQLLKYGGNEQQVLLQKVRWPKKKNGRSKTGLLFTHMLFMVVEFKSYMKSAKCKPLVQSHCMLQQPAQIMQALLV